MDGVLADLGVSSHHFDTRQRGFSFRFDAPLDMRMNQRARLSAADVVNRYEHGKIDRGFSGITANWTLRTGSQDASSGCAASGRSRSISDLIEAVAPVTPRGADSKFLAKLFQAIRIEVNGEMDALEMMLEQALRVLRPGGRLVVITYHSLEDRLVKNFMRSGNFTGKPEKDFYGRPRTPWELVVRKAIVPSAEETERNPRSRSAKLRAAEKR